ncbi:D-hexose-6-phosphate mutarotase [Microcoleus sp. bin38.metabat.b11b12b14.051]|uniref:D-hexose-6-phosphate mutarotase n=1 Tax=Microcoleus sp. bin38.metabat.b11b12b14.051 TaxID=2742709 RepID=UPI0025FB8A96|nr:D-hexose-6-phosphate mutarotase [Microcoleus sp. bin38.metabat.b11b12b14.051]
MSIDQLNAAYGIPGQLTFATGNGGFPMVHIDNGKAKALISVYSGQVLSFQRATETADLMFVSDKAYYAEGKAIKGGVPICWPWFGPDPEGLGRPAHGFVRNRLWNVVSTATTPEGATQVILGIKDTEETRAIWPQAFELAIVITVGTSLTVELITRNLGDKAFPLTQAFHTYFLVGDINRVQVLGLENSQYLDKVDGGIEKTQVGAVAVTGEVDRIYLDVAKEFVINDAALNRRIRIKSSGSKSAVVWNPWVKISASMADLDDTDYQRLICVETTNAATDIVEVPAGGEFRLQAIYSVERD